MYKIIKCKRQFTYINGVIGVKCGNTTLKCINNDWVDWHTGEAYTAVVNIKSGKIIGFTPRIGDLRRLVYICNKKVIN